MFLSMSLYDFSSVLAALASDAVAAIDGATLAVGLLKFCRHTNGPRDDAG